MTVTHRLSSTPTYIIWKAMRYRCNHDNPNYGGRNITYCARWTEFDNFLEDMGECPSPHHSLEREDVNGNYEPSNCVWATRSVQNSNRRPWHKKTSSDPSRCISRRPSGSYQVRVQLGNKQYGYAHKTLEAAVLERAALEYERDFLRYKHLAP